MSQRAVKKLRRWYNKDMRAAVLAQRNFMLGMIKPRPWWMPKWLWKRAIYFFLKIPEAQHAKKDDRSQGDKN